MRKQSKERKLNRKVVQNCTKKTKVPKNKAKRNGFSDFQ